MEMDKPFKLEKDGVYLIEVTRPKPMSDDEVTAMEDALEFKASDLRCKFIIIQDIFQI